MGSLGMMIRRELGAYFTSAMAYVILTCLLVVIGYYFLVSLDGFEAQRMPVRFEQHLWLLINILVMVTPLITMRLVAEEKNRGTLETMMTTPVSDAQFVLSKFVAAILFLQYILLIPLVAYAVVMSFHAVLDPGVIFTSYIGFVLVCSAVFAIGLFVSSLCENQITAGVITFVIALLLITMRIAIGQFTEGSFMWKFLSRLDIFVGAEEFFRGLIDTRDVVYFLSLTGLFLFLTVRIVESRRWR